MERYEGLGGSGVALIFAQITRAGFFLKGKAGSFLLSERELEK